ncbi:SepM family pheromone-processing serine protease [Paenibacillus sp. PL91]|uniref:SepM family pheromone-processing serine protease n=1 Tax=Paenibacillus sp. PL91 TaxID=2729538 RepID=UPI00145CDE13|nr:SepM family pheromone-processing serine protease [Paenibacillus sp. PL91]MBC9203549.1 PDZ domain-containing protein [Paenibacillus sp. PL91]
MTKRTNPSYRKRLIGLLVLIIFLAAITLIPLPYYIHQPGTVEKLSDYVAVESGSASSNGSFNLTTVYSLKVNNAMTMVYGLITKDSEIRKSDQVRGTLTDAQYGALLEHMMKSSQSNAVVSALSQAKKPVSLTYTGVFVQSLLPGSKAAGVLFPGDVIVEAEGKAVKRQSDIIAILAAGEQAGGTLELVVQRSGERINLKIQLYESAPGTAENVRRIGIVTEDVYTYESPVNVSYTESDIGGPSAGLMFSLEILDQLTEGELTHGKIIAGTGTIDASGSVGQIGGIRDKIIAAAHAGVDIFFCPADVMASDSNEKDILDEARKRGYKITIIPVRTLEEAMNELERLGG